MRKIVEVYTVAKVLDKNKVEHHCPIPNSRGGFNIIPGIKAHELVELYMKRNKETNNRRLHKLLVGLNLRKDKPTDRANASQIVKRAIARGYIDRHPTEDCSEFAQWLILNEEKGDSLTDDIFFRYTAIGLWKEIWKEHKIIFTVIYAIIFSIVGGGIYGIIKFLLSLIEGFTIN